MVAEMVTINQNPRASEASFPNPVSVGMNIIMSIVTIEIKRRMLFTLKWLCVFKAMSVMIKAPGIMTNESSAGNRKSMRKWFISMK